MKALFISCNQAYGEEILEILEQNRQRGFTRWTGVEGKGSFNGIPHMGSHAWPEQNQAVLAFVDEARLRPILDALHAKDEASPDLGLRAFTWSVEEGF